MPSYATGFSSSPVSVNRQVLSRETECSDGEMESWRARAEVADGRAFTSPPLTTSVPPKWNMRVIYALFRAWPCLETGDQMF